MEGSPLSDYQLRGKAMWFFAIWMCGIGGLLIGLFAFLGVAKLYYGMDASIPNGLFPYGFLTGITLSITFLYLWYLHAGRASKCPSCNRLMAGEVVKRSVVEENLLSNLLSDDYKCRHCQHTWTRLWTSRITFDFSGE